MKSIGEYIQNSSLKHPENIAVQFGKVSHTYYQLNNRANHVGDVLVRSMGKEKKAMVLLDKSTFLVESILGIFKAGKIFIPIHKDWLLKKSILLNTRFIITEEKYLEKWEELAVNNGVVLQVFIENQNGSKLRNYQNLNIIAVTYKNGIEYPVIHHYSEECYIYYTSGSSGQAKGVLGSQQGLLHFIEWEIEQFKVDTSFHISLLTNTTFDPFLRDLFVPLCSGGRLCIPEEDLIMDSEALIRWLDENKIVLFHMVPTIFKTLLREIPKSGNQIFKYLRYILLAGEPLKGSDVKPFYELMGHRIQLVNLYGPTETTLAKCFYLIQPEDSQKANIPVGMPIRNTEVVIKNDKGLSCKLGEIGEIYIKTKDASLGYYDKKELTEQVFQKDKENPKITMYRTGDIGRILENHMVECLGRKDSQVKIRGMKVHLSQIEQRIQEYSLIEQAVVICRKNDEGQTELVSYFTAKKKLNQNELYEYLSNCLQRYMIPSYMYQMEQLPKLLNGKTDRRRLEHLKNLPKEDWGNIQVKTTAQLRLREIWAKILKTENFSLESNFFLVGGNSLKAAKLVNQIRHEFMVDMKASDIFEYYTIVSLEHEIHNRKQCGFEKMKRAQIKKEYAVSQTQKNVYLAHIFQPDKSIYNMPMAVKVRGKLNIQRVKDALEEIWLRHESLRTNFFYNGEFIVQRVKEEKTFDLPLIKVETKYCSEKEKEERIAKQIENLIRPFDLSKDNLFRAALLEVSQEEYIIFWDMHHIVSDGISEEILKDEFTKRYNGQLLEPIKFQYKDYSEWDNDRENPEKLQDLKYWKEQFSDGIPVLNLPTDFPRKAERSFNGTTLIKELNETMVEELTRFCTQNNMTVYSVLLAVLYVLVSKYSGQETVVIGTVESGRRREEIEDTVGCFIYTAALRNCPNGEIKFLQFVDKVQESFIDMLRHTECSYEEVVKELRADRNMSHNPLFDVMFMLQNMEFSKMDMKNVKTEAINVERGVSKYDITLAAVQQKKKIALNFEYSTDLFGQRYMSNFADCYIAILEQVLGDKNLLIREMEFLGKETKQRMLCHCKGAFEENCEAFIHELVEQTVRKYPTKSALSFGNETITYLEMNKRANRLANRLIESGIQPESIVGIVLNRGIHMIVAVLAVLKAGGAYLPIDPTYPNKRIQYMLSDSRCNIVISDELNKVEGIQNLNVKDALNSEINSGNLNLSLPKSLLAYVIYTSGSTGNPKGVMLEHRNVVNFCEGMTEKIDFSSQNVMVCLTTISFDIFVMETLVPLIKGMQVVIASESEQLDAKLLSQLMKKYSATIMQVTPSRLRMFLENKYAKDCLSCIQTIVIGGEPLKKGLVEKVWNANHTLSIYNAYGPTETCVWSTVKKIEQNESITIGTGIKNTELYILDKNRQLLPKGIVGELYIGGCGLARGYLYREELSKERFIQNPFDKKKRMYRTGDLAKWNATNEIEFGGRVDNQVKVRGYRVELSEIEKCIVDTFCIQRCICILKEDKKTDSNYILAFYVNEKDILEKDFYNQLKLRLPEYMLPKALIRVKEVPLTPNGKVDKKQLLQEIHRTKHNEGKNIKATSLMEQQIAFIWSELLERNDIDLHDNFFEVGGNSFLLVKMLHEIDKIYADVVSVADVFANPTIQSIANMIKRRIKKDKTLKGITFPTSYRNYGKQKFSIIQKKVSTTVYNEIEKISKEIQMTTEKILFYLFSYLLSSITNYKKIPIQVFDTNNTGIESEIHLQEVTDFRTLFEAERKNSESYSVEEIVFNEEKETVIIGYLYDVEFDETKIGFVDLCLLIQENKDTRQLGITFLVNEAKINQMKVQELTGFYMMLINKMIS